MVPGFGRGQGLGRGVGPGAGRGSGWGLSQGPGPGPGPGMGVGRMIGDVRGKINAPTFAYRTLYGMDPPVFLSGRTPGRKKMWRGLDVDEGLRDEWLERLNGLPVEMRSSEEGKGPERPAFVIIRMPPDLDEQACDMTSALRRRGLICSYDIGQGSRPRICIVEKIWRGEPGWESWWEDLPDKIKDAYDECTSTPSGGVMVKLSTMLDRVAESLEQKGLLEEARGLDVISNTLDTMERNAGLIKKAANPEIKEIYETTKEVNPSHAASLIGERSTGSKWGENLTEEKLVSLPWEKYKGPTIPGAMIPIATYYKLEDANKHFPGARQRMETLDEAEKKGYKLSVQKGTHGTEIVSPDVKEAPIQEAWLIVGPAEDAEEKPIPGKKMIWTLLPGVLTGTIQNWDGKIESIPEDRKKHVAVKGI